MLALLLLAASLDAACLDELPPEKAACNQDDSCGYRCCRQPFDQPQPCYCSACCVGFADKRRLAPAAVKSCKEEGRDCDKAAQLLRGLAEDFRAKGLIKEAEAKCLELKALKPALERGDGETLFRHDGRSARVGKEAARFYGNENGAGKPAAELAFKCEPTARAGGGVLALCGGPGEFCGLVDLSGARLYEVALSSGQRAEPAAVAPSGKEAVFEIWRLEHGKWVLDHYAVWARPHSAAISDLRRRYGDDLYPAP